MDRTTASRSEELRRLRLLIDRLPALIGYWDRDQHNVVANQSYVDYFGMTPEEIRGRHIREVLGEDIYALNLPYIQDALAGREQLFERTLTDQRGATRYTQASYLPDVVDGVVRGFYVQVTDVTARVEAERARDEAVRMYEISIANAPFGNGVFDTSGTALQVNSALCDLLACSVEDLVGSDFGRFIHPEDLPAAEADRMALVRDREQVSSEGRYVRLDGRTIWMQRNAVLVPHAQGADDVIVAQFQDITARKRAEAELARMAVTDPLTGLNNRHALEECVRHHRDTELGASVGIIFVDLDGFKEVNDAHGHMAGDAVLIEAATRLAAVVPAPASVYRLGGDEFVVVVPSAESETVVSRLATLLGEAMDGRYEAAVVPVTLAASVGSTYGPAAEIERLLRIADSNMYQHKARRRSGGVLSTES
ncbi:sensor domain-containing protein [Mycolicibacterium hippocampi]|uniref:sensor domain-containing protein n=1 Tax=Mycolicibacterium hippocampi TaxID=659824 RepID=UPI0021F36803|nr:sensor domain-containing diguanylate cyclase [Mycolicibacterium hippocampi]